MKFQTKLYLFFAVTVILPISLATSLVAVMYTRHGDDAINDHLRDAVRTGAAAISSRADVLNAAASVSLRSRPGIITAAVNHDTSLAQSMLTAISQDVGAATVSLYDGNGTLVGSADGSAAAGGCPASTRIPLLISGSTGAYLAVSKPIDERFLKDTLENTGAGTALFCGGNTIASDLPPGVQPLLTDAGGPAAESAGSVQVDNDEFLTYQYALPAEAPAAPIIVMAANSNAEILSQRTTIVEAGLLLVAFTMLIASLLGYLLTRSISKPLLVLTDAVLRAEAGDLDCRTDIHSNDEVGALARNFNRMCGQIKKYIDQMRMSHQQLQEAFTLAGDLLVSGYDLERMAQSVNSTAALATGAEATAFFLFDEGGLAPVQLSPASFFNYQRINAINKKIEDLRQSGESGVIIHALEDGCVVLLAPMNLLGTSFGALVAALGGQETPPDEASCDILGSLANQAAAALENVRLNQALQQMVITDSLTGLYNVRYFNERLSAEMEQSRRQSQPLSLAVIDLDNFKRVNDTYGHQVGDEVLRQVGRLLAHNTRKPDLAARYGGEEFAIILPQTTKQAAYTVVEKLRLAATRLRIDGFPEIRVSFSAGVATCPMDAGEDQALLKAADSACYQAKEKGKNRTIAA